MARMFVLFICCFLIQGSYAVESLRFFVIGDMGGIDTEPYTTYVERSTAKEMGQMADLYAPQFILELGDNFYYEGVTDLSDIRFKSTFESVYTAKSLQVPWYLVAGNHDHRGNVTAQILYSKISKRWNFPDYYYYKEFPFPASKDLSIGFVMMDTVLLCGGTDDFIQLQPQGPEDKLAADKQMEFVTQTLKTSKATYLFTAGHYPVYSIAEHGPTKCLEDDLQPLLDTYGVNGHMSGHDHNLQHLRVKGSSGRPIDYFVSGMANFIDISEAHKDSVPSGSLHFHNANLLTKGGFLYAEAMATNMTLTFIDANGRNLYSTVVYPRKL